MATEDTRDGDGTRRNYIEWLSEVFERLAVWSFDHRRLVLTLSVLALVGCYLAAARTRFDNSLEAYFATADASYQRYLDYRRDFGSDERSYILYNAPDRPHGPWNIVVMRQIERLTTALETEVPFLRKVTSLSNVEFLEPIPDGIRVYDLLQEFPESQEALLAIRDKVLAKPIYLNQIVSPDGAYAAILLEMTKSSTDPLPEIRLDPEGGDGLHNLYPQASYAVIEDILGRPEFQGITFHHVGDVPLNAIYNLVVQDESTLLGGITFALISLLCSTSFGSRSA
jgi:predicted RND superfamily exporter protein